MNHDLLLELVICAEWQRIDSVREAVANCVSAVFGDVELRDSLSMVSAELLENAFKYGRPDQGVRLSLREVNDKLVVTVSNAVDPGSQHVPALESRLAWLHSFADPLEAYTAALQQVYERSNSTLTDSGLGIVRVYYEGHCQLQCDTSESGRVSMSATYRGPRIAEAS